MGPDKGSSGGEALIQLWSYCIFPLIISDVTGCVSFEALERYKRAVPIHITDMRFALVLSLMIVLPALALTGHPAAASPPIVLIDYPPDGAEFWSNETVELNASDSYDPDGKPIVVYWKDNMAGGLGYGLVLRVLLSVGGHTITCEVTDDDNEKASTVRHVTIKGLEPPIANLEADKPDVRVYDPVTFSGAKSVDPDFAIAFYLFDFGDGFNTTWIQSSITSHAYTTPGIYNARLFVKDTSGLTAQTNLTITVKAKPQVESHTLSGYVFLVALAAILIIVIIVILVVWNRIRVRGNRADQEELERRIRNPEVYRPARPPRTVEIRAPPEGGQARKVRQPSVRTPTEVPSGPRKVKAPVTRGRR